ncbi:hypothetical protein [Sphingomonas sp.]|uniref:hypothetical protein n=1 Tax=Sphingomonas sp. TaxID=28214 RepID=UPI000DB06975|nr:hypothetical protein [Sphingomonas sp.]PZU07028.1 MAG: hypothetical protein DI605_16875 [Sphingomonas sp.]
MTRTSGALGGVSDSALAIRGIAFGTPLARPTGFTYTRSLFPFDFWRDATGRVRTNFDRRAWAPTPDVMPWTTPATYYVDINRADDSGDGLSWAAAKKSIVAAVLAGNAGSVPYIVYVRAGLYPRLYGLGSGSTPTKACALIAVGGRVETGLFDALTWTLDTGTTWKATRADVRRVIDLGNIDQDGLRPDLSFAASLAACRSTPGSWRTDNTTVYVNRADAATVTDANTRALLMTGNNAVVRMSTGGNMYLSGFDVMGSIPLILQNAATYRFVAEDCTFRYSSGDDGIVVTGTKNMWHGATIFNVQAAAFIRCDASANQQDGFNSHIASGAQAFVFTMDCTGFNNGRMGSISNNFITTHDGGKWIDLRGVGARNAGGQVAIVNDGTMMWCIDTFCYASRGDQIFGGVVPPSDFLVDQQEGAGGSKLFLENCAAGSSQYSINAKFGTIYTRGGKFPKARLTASGGTIGALS